MRRHHGFLNSCMARVKTGRELWRSNHSQAFVVRLTVSVAVDNRWKIASRYPDDE